MGSIYRQIDVKTEVSVKETARLFCEMTSEEQAMFFNLVAKEVEEWITPFEIQLSAIVSDKSLTEKGRRLMEKIGEYAGI